MIPDYIEQEAQDELQENGGNPIESLLEGESALDQLLGGGQDDHDHPQSNPFSQ